MHQSNDLGAGGWIFILVMFAIYFLPAIVAHIRKHPQETAIGLLNIFLGWTLLGWVVALVWSATAQPIAAPVRQLEPGENPYKDGTPQAQQWVTDRRTIL
jgi:hypothetical protein